MKNVLFVCVENSCRSQMAEGFARIFGKSVLIAYSAGSRPSGKVNSDAIAVMLENGIDISKNQSKGFDSLDARQFDYVITMGCGDVCPFIPAKEHRNWEITDPKGRGVEFFRKTRDEIKGKVIELIKEIKEA